MFPQKAKSNRFWRYKRRLCANRVQMHEIEKGSHR